MSSLSVAMSRCCQRTKIIGTPILEQGCCGCLVPGGSLCWSVVYLGLGEDTLIWTL